LVHRVVGEVVSQRGMGTGERVGGVHVSLGPCDGPVRPADPDPNEGRKKGRGRELVTLRCLERVPDGGRFVIPGGASPTPAAREEAWRRKIELIEGHTAAVGQRALTPGRALRVAIASDHGGFAMKVHVLKYVEELGHIAFDLGCKDESAVDYPDFAHAVAEAVTHGRSDLGIVIDGAGIGSAMAANKVPGVRAAMCYDEQTARNAREHNYANVLSLGGRMLEEQTILDVVRAFLGTPEGAERHGRRVDKITGIERRYASKGQEKK
jgi:ribose 5-phosphate isomerase B